MEERDQLIVAGGQVSGRILGVQRARHQEALSGWTPEVDQTVELIGALDPFGHDVESHGAGEPDDGADQRRAGGLGSVEWLDEGPIDLQDVDGEPLEIAKGRVAGAEVVDGDGDAH